MQRSKFNIGCADAGAGGMSMTSGSGGASGMGASSSSSEASAMAQSTGSSGAGSGSICFAKRSSRAWRAAASVTASRKSSSLWERKRRQPVVHAWFCRRRPSLRELPNSAEDWRRHALFITIEDGAGKSGAHLRLEATLEAAEDCHVAGLQVRRASWREEGEHDMRESGSHGCQGGLAGVDAGQVHEKDPRLSLLPRVQNVVQSGRELQDRGRRCPADLACPAGHGPC